MVKCISSMTLLLLFLSEPSWSQNPLEPGRFSVAPFNRTAVNQQHIWNTLQRRSDLLDTLPADPLTIPGLLPHFEETEKHIKGLSPIPLMPAVSHPVVPALPFGSEAGPNIPSYKEKGNKTILPENIIMDGLKEDLGFSCQDHKQGIPVVLNNDPIRTSIPRLGTASNDFFKEAFRDEPIRLIPGKVVPDTVLHLMDSARRLVNVNKGLLQKEAQLDHDLKKVVFSDKPSFMDRAYLEGIIGLDPLTARIQNLSPALGYYVNPKMSFGLGPNINLGNPKDVLVSAVGSRSFLKYEVIQKKAYLQAENLSHLNKLKDPAYAREHAGLGKINHSLYLGAGYLLSISKALSLNVLMLYDLNGKQGATQQESPFNIRLGMSSFKPIE